MMKVDQTCMAQQLQINKPKPLEKKSASTDNFYQSTFMPIFQKAETKIKLLVLSAFLTLLGVNMLRTQIDGIIKAVAEQIPSDLRDKEVYLRGLKLSSEKYIRTFYKPMVNKFKDMQKNCTKVNFEPPKTPAHVSMWSKQKGSPNVTYYEKELRKKLDQFAADPSMAVTPGKKNISLWQKAELDVRYEHQLSMIENLKKDGVELAYISSHPNCSKRCECWQGELVSLNRRAKNPQKTVDKKFNYRKNTYLVGEINNQKIYSLTDITETVGAYGYNNNVIIGFNCRHRLIAYHGQKPPEQYSEEDIKAQREIENNIREMERKIRYQLTRAELYKKYGDEKSANAIIKYVKIMIERYKKYCEKNGYAWYDYRVKLM